MRIVVYIYIFLFFPVPYISMYISMHIYIYIHICVASKLHHSSGLSTPSAVGNICTLTCHKNIYIYTYTCTKALYEIRPFLRGASTTASRAALGPRRTKKGTALWKVSKPSPWTNQSAFEAPEMMGDS